MTEPTHPDQPHPDQPAPTYQWAVTSDPDVLHVQLPPVAVVDGDRVRDALRALFARRGFAALSDPEDLRARAANGCVLRLVDDRSAELVVTISEGVGVTRVPVPHHDPAWSARVLAAGEVTVLVTEAAIDPSGALTPERLAADVAAGGVSLARVPAGEL